MQDVDVLILKPCDREEIKRRMTIHDQRFYLEEPYTGALYYRPNGSTSDDAAIKIDVLTQGMQNYLPSVLIGSVSTMAAYSTLHLCCSFFSTRL